MRSVDHVAIYFYTFAYDFNIVISQTFSRVSTICGVVSISPNWWIDIPSLFRLVTLCNISMNLDTRIVS